MGDSLLSQGWYSVEDTHEVLIDGRLEEFYVSHIYVTDVNENEDFAVTYLDDNGDVITRIEVDAETAHNEVADYTTTEKPKHLE